MKESPFTLISLVIGTWFLGNMAVIFLLPSLPALAIELQTSQTLAKYTISIFLFGKTAGMLFYGPLSEKFGRRFFMLLGLGFYFFGSVLAILSHNIFILLIARLIQGLGTSATLLMGRVIINDKYKQNEAARIFSHIFLVTSIIISCLPTLGSFMATHFNWRAAFLVMSVYSFIFYILCLFFLKESSKATRNEPITLQNIFSHYRYIASHRVFLGYVLCSAFMVAGESAFITSSPFLLIDTLKISTQKYGFLMTFLEFGHLLGTFLCGRMVKHYNLETMMGIGVWILAISAALTAVLVDKGFVEAWLLITGMSIFYFGTGFVLTIATVGVVNPFPKLMATALAASLLLYFAFSTLSSAIVSNISTKTPEMICLLIAGYGFLALLSWAGLIWKKKVGEIV